MRNVLILGANGQVARYAIDLFLNETDAKLTLYLRNSGRLRNVAPDRVRVIEGDVRDTNKLPPRPGTAIPSAQNRVMPCIRLAIG